MFIKTRGSVLSEFDNKFPYVSLAYNDESTLLYYEERSKRIYDRVVSIQPSYNVITDNNLNFISIGIADMLANILSYSVKPSKFKSKTKDIFCLAFSDKRIGIVGFRDSRMDDKDILQTKHSFDYVSIKDCTDHYEITDAVFAFANALVKWIKDNHFGSDNIIYNGDTKKYVKLSIDSLILKHNKKDLAIADEYINQCLVISEKIVREKPPKGVVVSEVVRV